MICARISESLPLIKTRLQLLRSIEDKQIVTILNIFYGGGDYEAIMGSDMLI